MHRFFFNTAKEWGHSRLIAYTIYAVNATNKISIEEFLPLLTDGIKQKEPEITEDRKQELFEMAQKRAQILNNLH